MNERQHFNQGVTKYKNYDSSFTYGKSKDQKTSLRIWNIWLQNNYDL